MFARGLASSVCRTLKIDPRPVLERLPRTAAPRLIQNNDGINAPFRSPRDAIAPSWREQLTRPVSLIVGALLLGALVVVLLPRTHLDERAATADGKDALSGPVAAPVVAEAANPAITASAMSPAPPASQLVAASIRVPQTTDQGAAVPQAAPRAIAAPAAVVSPHEPAASAASAAAPATGAGVVVFRAKAPSWIEVRDAKGAVPIRKVLAAGESANVSGVMPLQVVIGNVQATEVDVRGKRFDLQPLTRDNVARFHIK